MFATHIHSRVRVGEVYIPSSDVCDVYTVSCLCLWCVYRLVFMFATFIPSQVYVCDVYTVSCSRALKVTSLQLINYTSPVII